MEPAISKTEAERAELDAILASGVLGKTNNLVRLLTFVCEKYFDGAIDEIKEYSIAVQVLGRPVDFDPQVDTIVRVTAHALRKRLEEYYRTAGAKNRVRICLPPGHYVPKFVHGAEAATEKTEDPGAQASQATRFAVPNGNGSQGGRPAESGSEWPPATPLGEPHLANNNQSSGGSKNRFGLTTAVLFLLAVVIAGLGWQKWGRAGNRGKYATGLAAAAAPLNPVDKSLRALAGNDRPDYVDRAGSTWLSDRFCTGGSSFSVSGHTIQGTEDPQLFTAGRRGIFHCSYPVAPGNYEVHLLFAETAGLQENSRFVGFSINGKSPSSVDLVDDAGGNDISTTKVYSDVEPENDGEIHVDFSSPDAVLNAIEILPAAAHKPLPIRIIVGHSAYHDTHGNVWLPDRYFFGGRLSRFVGDLSRVPDGPLYEWHRFGHFRYVVPVASGSKYTVKLYFLEHWFGVQNGGIGGVGSRVFDVYCNGSTLLKAFDIFREAGTEPLVKTFAHVEPTPQGKIEIYFTPAVNYPSISAIEVLPE